MLRSIGDDVDSFFREIVNCGARGCSPASLGRAVRGKPSGEWDVRDYRSNIEPYYELSKNELAIPFGLSGVPVLKPFDSFDTTSPGWWTAYNHVKHDYYNTMREATLGNVLGALGGLLLLNALHKCSQHYLVLTGNLVGGLRIKNIEQRVNPNYLAAVLDKSCTGLPASHRDVSSSWLTTEVFQFRMRSDRSS